MGTRFCPSCKTSANGFIFCPTCGGKTELLTAPSPQSLTSLESERSNNKISNQIAMWCHLAPLLLSIFAFILSFIAIGFILSFFLWVPPLIIKSKNINDSFVKSHANEAINFQLFWLIFSFGLFLAYLTIGVLTLGIGLILGGVVAILLVLPIAIFFFVTQLRATMAASAGYEFSYPLVFFRLVK